MSTLYFTKENDMVDEIAYTHYGWCFGTVERVLLANPGLAEYGSFLPAGLTIMLPDIPKPGKQPVIRLWD
jgi:phage tail protein X